MPGRIHRSAQHIRNRTARVAACSRSPENRSNIRIVRHPSQLKSIIGIDRKNHIVKIVIEVLNHPKLHRIRLQIMLFFVLLHVGPVSHITSEVTPLAAGPGNEKTGIVPAAAGIFAVIVTVKLPKRFIHEKSLLREGGAHIARNLAHTGTRTAGQQIIRRCGKQTQCRAAFERKALSVLIPVI